MSESKKIKTLLFSTPSGVLELNVKSGEHYPAIKKQHGIAPKVAEALWKDAEKGLDEPSELASITDNPKLVKELKDNYKKITNLFNFHDAETVRREKAKEKAEADEKKRGEKLTLQVQAGRALGARAATITDVIQGVVGKDFRVTEQGLVMAEGKTLDEFSAGKALSGLFEMSDGMVKGQASVGLAIGDILVLMESIGKDSIAFAAQVASASGKDKHTVTDYINIAKTFPVEDRIPGLFTTHYKEAHQALQTKDDKGKVILTKAKVLKILADAAQGEKTVDITTEEGKPLTQHRPISCAKLREKLNEAMGDRKPVKDKPAAPAPSTGSGTVDVESEVVGKDEGGSQGYLYIGADATYTWPDLLEDLVNSGDWLIIDLDAMVFMTADKSGKPVEDGSVEPLPEQLQPAKEEAPAKKKGKKAKEAPPTQEADSDDVPPL